MESLCNTTTKCTVSLGDSLCVRGSDECYNYNCLYVQHGMVYCTNPTFDGCQNGVICPKDVNTRTPVPTITSTPLTPNVTTSSISPISSTIPVSSTKSPTPTESKSNTTSIVLGVVLGIAVIAAIVLWFCWRRKRQREDDEDHFVVPTTTHRRHKQESIVLSRLHMNVESSALDSIATKSMFNTVGRQSNHEFMTEKSDWWQNSTQSLLVNQDPKKETDTTAKPHWEAHRV